MSFVYGKPIQRLSADGVRISSAVYERWIQACGFDAATSLKRAQSSDATTSCSSTVRPCLSRCACSKSGYTCTGIMTPRRSEEHTSELQSLMRHSDAVFCLQQNKTYIRQ